MKRLAKAALIVRLRDELERRGSWCGETHVQKAVYVLQEGAGVQLEFDFVLYRHGPFSFALREELVALRAEGMLSLQPQSAPYGPRLVSTPEGNQLVARFPRTVGRNEDAIERVAEFVGSRRVVDLERVATSLMLIRGRPDERDENLARQMTEIKPHIRYDAALSAIGEARAFLEVGRLPA